MKHLQLKCTAVSAGILLIYSLLSACQKNNFMVDKPEHRSIRPAVEIYDKLPAELQILITRIEQDAAQRDNCLRYISRAGKIYWGKALKGTNGSTRTYVVPLKRDRDTCFTSFIVFGVDSVIRSQLYEWQAVKTLKAPSKQGIPSATDVNHILNALNHRGFGKKTYSTEMLSQPVPPSMFSIPTASARRPVMDDEIIIVVPECYTWKLCLADAQGNCITQEYSTTSCIETLLWINDYTLTYVTSGAQGGQAGGGGSLPSNSGYKGPILTPVYPREALFAPKTPIDDIAEYLKCFMFQSNATITVQVAQPTPGATDPISMFGGIGHVFLTIEQVINGQTIRRTIGFYPQTKIDPFRDKSAQGVLGDDGGRNFNIKWSTTINGFQLQDMIYFALQPVGNYHIDQYNCANYVLDMMDAGGVHLPRTNGWWLTGSGLNPGNLGEDLRQLPGSVSGRNFGVGNTGECN